MRDAATRTFGGWHQAHFYRPGDDLRGTDLPQPLERPHATSVERFSVEGFLVMNADGSDLTNLTKTPRLNEMYPDFSPDGSKICFTHYSTGAQKAAPGIYVMDPDGSDTTLLVEDELTADAECDWSPDETKIAFHAFSDAVGDDHQKAVDKALAEGDFQKAQEKLDKLRFERNNREVYVMNTDGTGRTTLTYNLASDAYPRWSPDGTKIVFASDRDGDVDLYTMDADGSDVVQVTNSRNDEGNPDWQPLPGPTEAKPENQQQPPQQDSKSRSVTVHPPDTGGPSLLLAASALLFAGGVLFYAGVKRRM